jgi:O-antigen ligase
MIIALALTFSKGALLLGLPAAVLFIGFAAGGRWRWIASAAVGLGALALLPLFRTERFAGLFDLQSGTSFFRVQLWRGAWNMALDHPWLGVGPDNFLYAYRTTYVLPAAWQELNLSHPHNIFLDFGTRLGLPSVLVGVWLFVAAFGQGWRAFRRRSGAERALALGLLASLVATLAHGLIDNSLFLVDLMFLAMLSMGMISRLSQNGAGDLGNA